jgi:uncharacterized protein (TIGR00266 family)
VRFEIRNRPDYASLHVVLNQGEQFYTESGAMMGMSAALKMETAARGGLMGAAKRMLGGESVFMNTYTATADGQRLDIAPSAPGDLVHVPISSGAVLLQSGSFCAASPGVEISAKWAGAKGFFSGEGLILLRCHGQGDLFISSYGAIESIDVQGSYVVDTSHIVGFEDTLSYNVGRVGGMKSLFLSGEGLVCNFTGRGRLWFQTRNAPALASFLNPFRPQKRSK